MILGTLVKSASMCGNIPNRVMQLPAGVKVIVTYCIYDLGIGFTINAKPE